MRQIAALFTFVLLAGTSTLALADAPGPEEEKQEEKEADKKADEKDDKKADKSGGCTVSENTDTAVVVAALALLLSGVALRSRD